MELITNKRFSIPSFILLLLFSFIISYRELWNIYSGASLTTVVIATILFSVIYFIFSRKSTYNLWYVLLLLVTILSYMYISSLWSRNVDYGLQKIYYLLPFLLITYFIYLPFIEFNSQFRIILIVISLLVIIPVLINNITTLGNLRLKTSDDTNPIKLARYSGFLIITFWFFTRELPIKWIWMNSIFILSFVLFISVILLSGSKGPLLSLLLAIVIINLSSSQKFHIKAVILLFLSLTVFFLLPYFLDFLPNDLRLFLISRFDLFSDEYDSLNSRTSMIKFGITNFDLRGLFNIYFGNGIGDYAFAFKYAEYPHNLIIEILFEFGLLGISALFIALRFLFLFIKSYTFQSINIQYITFSCLYFFLTSMSTGDISGNYLFFSFILMLYMNNQYREINV